MKRRTALLIALLVVVSSTGFPACERTATAHGWYRSRVECRDEARALRVRGLSAYAVRQGEWIAWRESKCGADVVGPTDDWGHWQIHAPVWLRTLCRAGIACSRSALRSLTTSARATVYLYRHHGRWKHWCYNGCPWGSS